MDVYVGQIISNIDLDKGLPLSVQRVGAGQAEDPVDVIYTSPYGGKFSPDGKAGFFAIPGVKSKILFTKASDSKYYYLSTIHDDAVEDKEDPGKTVDVWKEKGPFFPGVFNVSGEPQRLILADPVGNKLQFNHHKDIEMIQTGIILQTRDEKQLILADSPEGDGIYLQNKERDGLTIAGKYRSGYSAGQLTQEREVRLKSFGMIRLHSDAGEIQINCPLGRDINIETGGAGPNVLFPPLNIASPPEVIQAQVGPLFQSYGNTRVASKVRDVCISAGETHSTIYSYMREAWNPLVFRSRVMIRAYGPSDYFTQQGGGLLQMMSDGSIIIRALTGKIFIHGGEVNIKSETDVNIQAKQSVNLAAGGFVRMTSTVVPTPPETPLPRLQETDFVGYALDKSIASGVDADKLAYANGLGIPSVGGHIELSPSGAIINGTTVSLAPTIPTIQADKASHLPWELSDYDIQI